LRKWVHKLPLFKTNLLRMNTKSMKTLKGSKNDKMS
jgi:hypothetical protein